MKLESSQRWFMLIVLNVLGFCVLGFWQTSQAQQQESNLPFANAVQQRQEMISQLKEINALLKEQNALLRSGNVRVVTAPPGR